MKSHQNKRHKTIYIFFKKADMHKKVYKQQKKNIYECVIKPLISRKISIDDLVLGQSILGQRHFLSFNTLFQYVGEGWEDRESL